MRLRFVFVMLGGLLSCAASAQTASSPSVVAAATPAAPATRQMVLPIYSEVMVSLDTEIDSRHVKRGDTFAVTVSRDVMIGRYIVIPRGTPGVGEITLREGKGAFAKPAIIELDLRSLTLGGHDLPISGHFRQDGRDNNMVMTGAVAAVGVLSGFVTGHSANFTRGRELRGFTRASLPVLLPPGD
ncbi:hypothetical protein BH10PSE14_BH10PSE14_37560 [soil metagenome]